VVRAGWPVIGPGWPVVGPGWLVGRAGWLVVRVVAVVAGTRRLATPSRRLVVGRGNRSGGLGRCRRLLDALRPAAVVLPVPRLRPVAGARAAGARGVVPAPGGALLARPGPAEPPALGGQAEHRLHGVRKVVGILVASARLGSVDPSLQPYRPPGRRLPAEGVGERLDRVGAVDGVPVQVEEGVELDEPQRAVAVQQGQAGSSQCVATKRFRVGDDGWEGNSAGRGWPPAAVVGELGPQPVVERPGLVDDAPASLEPRAGHAIEVLELLHEVLALLVELVARDGMDAGGAPGRPVRVGRHRPRRGRQGTIGVGMHGTTPGSCWGCRRQMTCEPAPRPTPATVPHGCRAVRRVPSATRRHPHPLAYLAACLPTVDPHASPAGRRSSRTAVGSAVRHPPRPPLNNPARRSGESPENPWTDGSRRGGGGGWGLGGRGRAGLGSRQAQSGAAVMADDAASRRRGPASGGVGLRSRV
jgi:hypothetical protein